MKKTHVALAGAILIISVLVASMLIKFPVGVFWKSEAESPDGNFHFVVDGATELIGANDEPIKLQICMKSILPMSFYYEGIEVKALKVSLSYQADGRDVDWNTLKIYVDAKGTGGYSKSKVFNTKTGTAEFILPFSTSLLGRTPKSGEEVTWKMTVTVKGEVRDLTGRLLTAETEPLTASAKTKWYSPSFSVTTSTSTSVTTSSGETVTSGTPSYTSSSTETSSTTVYGGGCGSPGQHLVWTSNVQPQTENPWFWINSTLTVTVIFYGLLISGAILIAIGLRTK